MRAPTLAPRLIALLAALLLASAARAEAPTTAPSDFPVKVIQPADAWPDHVARFGRNLDFMSFGIADKSSVLLVYKPNGRYAFAAVTWPGMIGCLSGMNEHGLALANMEVTRGVRLPGAMPYVMLY